MELSARGSLILTRFVLFLCIAMNWPHLAKVALGSHPFVKAAIFLYLQWYWPLDEDTSKLYTGPMTPSLANVFSICSAVILCCLHPILYFWTMSFEQADDFMIFREVFKSVGGKGDAFYATHLCYVALLHHFLLSTKVTSVSVEEVVEEQKQSKCRLQISSPVSKTAFKRQSEVFVHACIFNKKRAIRQVLASPDFDVNGCVVADGGLTPLHLATMCANVTAVRLLLQKRQTSMTALDDEGRRAVDLALELRRTHVLDILVNDKKWQPQPDEARSLLAKAISADAFSCASAIGKRLCSQERLHLRPVGLTGADLEGFRLITSAAVGVSEQRQIAVRKKFILERLQTWNSSTQSEEEESTLGNQRVLVEDLQECFECPVCSECMLPASDSGATSTEEGEHLLRIFACQADHWLCSGCACDSRMKACPICRDDFLDHPPRRLLHAEKVAKAVANLLSAQSQEMSLLKVPPSYS